MLNVLFVRLRFSARSRAARYGFERSLMSQGDGVCDGSVFGISAMGADVTLDWRTLLGQGHCLEV
jgi:hypothetical protein